MGNKKGDIHTEYTQYYWLMFVGAFLAFAVYMPNILLGANAYVGNQVMVTYLGYMLYFLISGGVLWALWLVVFWLKIVNVDGHAPRASKKSGSLKLIFNLRETFEYKYQFWTWFILSVILYGIQLALFIWISVGITTTSEAISISDVSEAIGNSGKSTFYDDVFQITSLLMVIGYLFVISLFIQLHITIAMCASKTRETEMEDE